ncbi:hypothetical protein QEZ47_20795 [Aminobacter anthyllidis]|uniref:hypothetical protein n=1 Tax=Aminobacter anthyllidis TaxID=1035067 RepID=UPI002458C7A3|nr:hypothetical protein [Aminobacter anthyllidis]MDH4987911.1 hypothetical protein [Aminobacter anthyllidis]
MTLFPTGRRPFFLQEIGEPEANVLRVVVAEASAQENATTVPGTDIIARPVTPVTNEQSWQLTWDSYVAYAVRNESYWQSDSRPDCDDRLLVRSQSAFLDFVGASTFASDDFPGKYSHWELICADHVIDVVSTSGPYIERRLTRA